MRLGHVAGEPTVGSEQQRELVALGDQQRPSRSMLPSPASLSTSRARVKLTAASCHGTCGAQRGRTVAHSPLELAPVGERGDERDDVGRHGSRPETRRRFGTAAQHRIPLGDHADSQQMVGPV